MIKRLAAAVIGILIFVAGFSLLLNFFVSDFQQGLTQINQIDRSYNFYTGEIPMDFIYIAKSPPSMENLTNLRKELEQIETDDPALKRYIDLRISLINAETFYKMSLTAGKAGEISDGFGCKDSSVILSTSSYRNRSAQYGLTAAKQFGDFLRDYPNQAKLVGFPSGAPLAWNTSFSTIQRRAEGTVNFINRMCVNK